MNTDEVMQLLKVPLPSQCYEDSDGTTNNDPKTLHNKKGCLHLDSMTYYDEFHHLHPQIY